MVFVFAHFHHLANGSVFLIPPTDERPLAGGTKKKQKYANTRTKKTDLSGKGYKCANTKTKRRIFFFLTILAFSPK